MATAQMETDNQPGITELVSGMVHDAQKLVHQQLTLFQVELKNDMHRTVAAAVPLLAGVIACFIGGIILALALAYLLTTVWPQLPLWAALAIVGGVVAGSGGVLVLVGRNRFAAFNPLPDQTVEGLQENIQWQTKR